MTASFFLADGAFGVPELHEKAHIISSTISHWVPEEVELWHADQPAVLISNKRDKHSRAVSPAFFDHVEVPEITVNASGGSAEQGANGISGQFRQLANAPEQKAVRTMPWRGWPGAARTGQRAVQHVLQGLGNLRLGGAGEAIR